MKTLFALVVAVALAFGAVYGVGSVKTAGILQDEQNGDRFSGILEEEQNGDRGLVAGVLEEDQNADRGLIAGVLQDEQNEDRVLGA